MEMESQNSRVRQSHFENISLPNRTNQRRTDVKRFTQESNDLDPNRIFLGQKTVKIDPLKRWELVSKIDLIYLEINESTTKLYTDKNKKDLVGLINTSYLSNFEFLHQNKAIFYEVTKHDKSMITISSYLNQKFKLEDHTGKADDISKRRKLKHQILESFRILFQDLHFKLTKPAIIPQLYELKETINSEGFNFPMFDKNMYHPSASMPIDSKKASKKDSDAMRLESQNPKLEEAKRAQDGTDSLDTLNLKSKNFELNSFEQMILPHPEFTSQLLNHQKECVSWMLAKEGKLPELNKQLQSQFQEDLHPIIEEWRMTNGKKFYFDTQNAQILTEPPTSEQAGGGILADDNGLGKKVSTLALIFSNPWKKDIDFLRSGTTESESIQDLPIKKSKIACKPSHSSLRNHFAPKKILGGTLIVCPSTHEDLWRAEIYKHVKKTSTKILYYRDSQRMQITADMIPQNDIVIVTYDLLSKEEISVNQAILTSIYWHRVVLDEAHYTNKSTNFAPGAVFKLEAKYRWILSRTPSQNIAYTSYNKLKFLRISPWDSQEYHWKKLIAKARFTPDLLYSVLRPILLRHTKESVSLEDQKVINSARQTIKFTDKYITLDKDEEEAYQKERKEVEKKFIAFCEKEASSKEINAFKLENQRSFSICQNTTKLRQICDNQLLLEASKQPRGISEEDVLRLTKRLQDQQNNLDSNNSDTKFLFKKIKSLKNTVVSDEICCPVCWEIPDPIVFSACGHIYCRFCYSNCIKEKLPCSICRKGLTSAGYLTLKVTTVAFSLEQLKRSSKVDAVIGSIISIKNQREKCVCFTQWTLMMDILGNEMTKRGIKFVKIDGSCNKTEELYNSFSKDPEITVIMIYMVLSDVEVDLTEANHVLLVEPWWNSKAEKKAIGMVHRTGQTKQVYVTRFVCKGTIEERMISLPKHMKHAQNKSKDEELKYLLNIKK